MTLDLVGTSIKIMIMIESEEDSWDLGSSAALDFEVSPHIGPLPQLKRLHYFHGFLSMMMDLMGSYASQSSALKSKLSQCCNPVFSMSTFQL